MVLIAKFTFTQKKDELIYGTRPQPHTASSVCATACATA